MIQEKKTFSMADLARVVSNLCFARNYFNEQVTFYQSLLVKEYPTVGQFGLPLSPLGEFYQKCVWDNAAMAATCNRRLERLQGIADHTHLPDLDY